MHGGTRDRTKEAVRYGRPRFVCVYSLIELDAEFVSDEVPIHTLCGIAFCLFAYVAVGCILHVDRNLNATIRYLDRVYPCIPCT